MFRLVDCLVLLTRFGFAFMNCRRSHCLSGFTTEVGSDYFLFLQLYAHNRMSKIYFCSTLYSCNRYLVFGY